MKPTELKPKLSKVFGIEIGEDRKARCLSCGVIWTPRALKSGELCMAWFLCPEGCNRGRLLPDPERTFALPLRSARVRRKPAARRPQGDRRRAGTGRTGRAGRR